MNKYFNSALLSFSTFFLISTVSAQILNLQQKNVFSSIKQYLSIQSFSREGLIDQLSSNFGEGYSVYDATVAVDSLNIDWNKQAEKSARNYLDLFGLSCKGLIEQLSSSTGDKYTKEQATYGARSVGAC